ncbi:MAG: hypothetical protein ACYC26_13445 [Phycisphaerales bacterium]
MKYLTTILFAVFTFLAGCQCTGSHVYVISDTVADSLQGPAGPDQFYKHYDELLYMVKAGNPKVRAAVIRVFPAVIRSDCSCGRGQASDARSVMAFALLEPSLTLDVLDPLSVADKEFMLRYYGTLQPLDFEGPEGMLETYLQKHSEIKKENTDPAHPLQGAGDPG